MWALGTNIQTRNIKLYHMVHTSFYIYFSHLLTSTSFLQKVGPLKDVSMSALNLLRKGRDRNLWAGSGLKTSKFGIPEC